MEKRLPIYISDLKEPELNYMNSIRSGWGEDDEFIKFTVYIPLKKKYFTPEQIRKANIRKSRRYRLKLKREKRNLKCVV